MSIPVTCECGATFSARDSFAGRAVTCRSCGATLTVPGEPAAPDLSVEPLKEAPRVVGKKRKKKSASGKERTPLLAGVQAERRRGHGPGGQR